MMTTQENKTIGDKPTGSVFQRDSQQTTNMETFGKEMKSSSPKMSLVSYD